MPRVKFTETTTYEIHGRNNPENPVYEAGKSYDLREDIAERFVRRGVAIKDTGRTATPAQPPKVESKPPAAPPAQPPAKT